MGKDEKISGNSALSAAAELFPAHSFEIKQMMAADEAFRGLCADLADAQHALQRIDLLPVRLRAERRIECESWVEGLAQEIELTLRRKKVIALGAKRNPPDEG